VSTVKVFVGFTIHPQHRNLAPTLRFLPLWTLTGDRIFLRQTERGMSDSIQSERANLDITGGYIWIFSTLLLSQLDFLSHEIL